MTNILSLENISSNISSFPVQIFTFDNQVYQLEFDALPATHISIRPFQYNTYPKTIYSSNNPIFIEKIKVDPFHKRFFLCGFQTNTKIGFYAISNFTTEFQTLNIIIQYNLEKVEDILFIDESNFLVLGTTKENNVWIIHPNYLPLFEIKELNGKICSIKDSNFKNDQINIYIEVLENAVKSLRIYRYSSGDLLSAFI
jgi:hypothetical protein